jgi:hypothetical protein
MRAVGVTVDGYALTTTAVTRVNRDGAYVKLTPCYMCCVETACAGWMWSRAGLEVPKTVTSGAVEAPLVPFPRS